MQLTRAGLAGAESRAAGTERQAGIGTAGCLDPRHARMLLVGPAEQPSSAPADAPWSPSQTPEGSSCPSSCCRHQLHRCCRCPLCCCRRRGRGQRRAALGRRPQNLEVGQQGPQLPRLREQQQARGRGPAALLPPTRRLGQPARRSALAQAPVVLPPRKLRLPVPAAAIGCWRRLGWAAAAHRPRKRAPPAR